LRSEAQYLHDSVAFRFVLIVKLLLAVSAIPLLWNIRTYKTKVLVHQSLAILMKYHYYYLIYLATSSCVDFSITLYKYQSR
ncbi:hypothetical protein PMAYCL1PPCAC_04792, partial [Pristionchus mayeri]